jgi:hypothetical protein
LSDGEFWSLTDYELAALVERHRESEKRADYRAGVIASTLVQINSEKGKGAKFTPDFFFPSLQEESVQQDVPGAEAFRMYLEMYANKQKREHGGSDSDTPG